jgi:hypothetical protein
MAVTLSYGYIKNESGDRGSEFWPDLEFNIERINGHSHNGTDSALIPTSSIDTQVQTLLADDWEAVAGQTGTYKQTVTVPSGVNLDKHLPRFKDANGNILLLSVDVLTTGTYDVYINDNTAVLQVAYV